MPRTGSLYTGLLSLITSHAEAAGTHSGKRPARSDQTDRLSLMISLLFQADAEKRALMFSYGSGLAASLFSVKLRSAEGLQRIAATSNFKARLAQRKKVSPAEFTEILKR